MGVTTLDIALDDQQSEPTHVANETTTIVMTSSKSDKAHKTLKTIWAFKAVFDAFLTAALLFILATAKISVDTAMVPALMAASVGLWVIQLVAIFGLYQRNPWSLWMLHVFSLVSFLQLPVGTLLAVIHFVKVRHLDFSHSN